MAGELIRSTYLAHPTAWVDTIIPIAVRIGMGACMCEHAGFFLIRAPYHLREEFLT
jgi:hypothetical protein